MNSASQESSAAFFDLDGTLLPEPSLERRFLRFVYERGEWNPMSLARWFGRFLGTAALGERGAEGERFFRAIHGNKLYLKKLRAASVEDFWSEMGAPEFFLEGVLRIAWHAAQSHRIFLVTGTLYPLAERIAEELRGRLRQGTWPGFVGVCATPVEMVDGHWTGEIRGEAVCGRVKACVIERLAEEHALDLGRSFAYGNSPADQWMLARVGNPVAVNPSSALRRVARAAGWPMLSWGKNPPQRRRDSESRKEENDDCAVAAMAISQQDSRRTA